MSAIPNSYLTPATVSAMQAAAAANGGNDRKTLICLFFLGGIDTHNLLVPMLRDAPATNSAAAIQRRNQYVAARPVPAVGHDNGALIPLGDFENGVLVNDGFGATYSWGLPLTQGYLSDTYNYAETPEQIKCAFVRHVGTLDQPLTKAQYLADPRVRPDQLFAHNVQTDLWQAALAPDVIRTTGWFGRAMNLMDPYYNVGQTIPLGALTTSGSALQGRAHDDLSAVAVPSTTLSAGDSKGNAGWTATFRNGLRGVSAPYATSKNLIHRSFVSLMTRAEQEQAAVSTALAALPTAENDSFTALPVVANRQNPFREVFRTAARVIYSQGAARFNQRRQVIFIGVGGWDHHSALRTNQDPMLQQLNSALDVFWSSLESLGVQQNVTMFSASEFSRTFQSNGTSGTDHAWAGHHFVLGSMVKPGMYGPDPDYTINGPKDTGQGRFIPDVSTDQYFSTLLKWFGIPEAQLPLVLPNLPAFPVSDIGFMNTAVAAPAPAPAPAPTIPTGSVIFADGRLILDGQTLILNF